MTLREPDELQAMTKRADELEAMLDVASRTMMKYHGRALAAERHLLETDRSWFGKLTAADERIEELSEQLESALAVGRHREEIREAVVARAKTAEKRAEELEARLAWFREMPTAARLEVAESKLETMRKALEWYADPANNGPRTYRDGSFDTVHDVPLWLPIDDDEGEVAREALGTSAAPDASTVNPGSLPG